MKQRHYLGATASIYINYALVGMITIILSQYSTYFQKSWHTDIKGISIVLAVVGLGRILTILSAGVISDKIGRKKTLLIALVADIIFLLGAAYAHNLLMACIAALFFGVTNSFGDAAGYPALTDAYPNKSATMNSLVKAAMSLCQFLFPFWVAAVTDARLTAIVLALALAANILLTLVSPFAPHEETPQKNKVSTENATAIQPQTKGQQPKMAIDGALLIALGFTICFTFYVFSQYLPNFGVNVLGVSASTAKTLVSWYAMASLISVFITAIAVTKIKRLTLIIIYTALSAAGLFLMLLKPSLLTARIGSLAIGFFGAGGIWQVGLSILTSYFPKGHGKLTSYYSFMAAVTYFLGPLLSSFVISTTAASVLTVFWITAVDTVISVVITLLLIQRRQHLTLPHN
ncbi:MFS transporter [Loigolactobacillus rennini]|uniref:Transport protein n=1 Tax=Loigolactobacillus rennini DSM 20253 TaxID=1423796 RepID=A0A0R2D5Z4_9LACO|nr:MFS transporter [Loigolactobacillus rennini]KRM99351.1 transport protein [Loigolactobacillus rennini DSM 20253]